jgi:hypothetical protein
VKTTARCRRHRPTATHTVRDDKGLLVLVQCDSCHNAVLVDPVLSAVIISGNGFKLMSALRSDPEFDIEPLQ